MPVNRKDNIYFHIYAHMCVCVCIGQFNDIQLYLNSEHYDHKLHKMTDKTVTRMTKTSCFLVIQIPAAKDNEHPDKKHLLLFKTPNRCPRKTKASAHTYHSPMRAKSSQDVMVNSWTALTTICFEPDRGRAECSGRSMQ